MGTELTGTKKIIFDIAVEHFATYGFENIGMREIAKNTGIKSSSIYNHFSSKNEILDYIYSYFLEHYNDTRKSKAELKEMLKTCTKEEFINALSFTFETPDEKKYRRMILIVKIIYMRIFNDSKANNIFLITMNRDNKTFVKEILEFGVSIGRISPFDIDTYADFLIGQRQIMGIKAFANPEYVVQQLEEEKLLMKMLTDILPFKE